MIEATERSERKAGLSEGTDHFIFIFYLSFLLVLSSFHFLPSLRLCVFA